MVKSDYRIGKSNQMTYEAYEKHKNSGVEWGHKVEGLTQ